jgi:hypothetical protein
VKNLPLDLEKMQGDIFVSKGMIKADFTFWVGLAMDKFYDGTKEQKFIGTKCSKCGKTFLPPRNRCGDCFAKAEEFVDLPETATLKNFTATPWKITERRVKKGNKDTLVGLVQVDGADSAFITEILNTTEDKLEEGMKLKVVWAKRIKGHPLDIAGFEPIGGG